MCARFTVLSDTPIAAAIAGCVIPLSRNNTIWMRWRCAAGIFHRSAVFSRRTSALLHLTIWSSESDGASESRLGQEKQPAVPAAYLVKDPRFKPLWRWYEMMRVMLYEAAQSMLRSKKWSWLKAWAMQIARRRGMKKAIVALARRLAVIMHRIWVDGTAFRWTREIAAA